MSILRVSRVPVSVRIAAAVPEASPMAKQFGMTRVEPWAALSVDIALPATITF